MACGPTELVIRRYYPWGSKRIPYQSIRRVTELPLVGADSMRRWRIWGSGDFVHWWNLDGGRPDKTMALVLDVGRRILPTIPPDDAGQVARLLRERAGLDG